MKERTIDIPVSYTHLVAIKKALRSVGGTNRRASCRVAAVWPYHVRRGNASTLLLDQPLFLEGLTGLFLFLFDDFAKRLPILIVREDVYKRQPLCSSGVLCFQQQAQP